MYRSCRGVLGGGKSATACITSLHVPGENTGFNLAVSNPTAKPPNLIPRQIFRLYGIPMGNEFKWLLKEGGGYIFGEL